MKYIYEYMDAAMNVIQMGPYNTKAECKEHMNRHASFGCRPYGPKDVPDDYEIIVPDIYKD